MQGIYEASLSDVEVMQLNSDADDVNIGESRHWSNQHQYNIGSVNLGLLFAISCNRAVGAAMVTTVLTVALFQCLINIH